MFKTHQKLSIPNSRTIAKILTIIFLSIQITTFFPHLLYFYGETFWVFSSEHPNRPPLGDSWKSNIKNVLSSPQKYWRTYPWWAYMPTFPFKTQIVTIMRKTDIHFILFSAISNKIVLQERNDELLAKKNGFPFDFDQEKTERWRPKESTPWYDKEHLHAKFKDPGEITKIIIFQSLPLAILIDFIIVKLLFLLGLCIDKIVALIFRRKKTMSKYKSSHSLKKNFSKKS